MTAPVGERDEHAIGLARDTRDSHVGRADLRIGIGVSLLSLLWLLAFAHANPFESLPSDPTPWIGPLAGGLLAGVFYLFQRSLGTGPAAALGCAVFLSTASYLAVSAIHAPEQTVTALFIVAALFALHAFRTSGGLFALAAGALFSGACAASGAPTHAAALALAGYGAFCLIARRSAANTPIGVTGAILLVGFAAAPAWVILGGAEVPGLWHATPSPAVFSEPVFSEPVYSGLHRWLLSPGAGLFAYTPLLVLAPAALAAGWPVAKAELATALGIALLLLLASSALDPTVESWVAPGPRHLVSLSALLLLPLGSWLEASRGRARWSVVFAIGFGAACAQAALMATSWTAVIETMGYRDFSSPADFVFMPHTMPLLGAGRLIAQGRIEIWSATSGGLGLACYALAIAAGASLLTLAARRHPTASVRSE